MDLLNALPRFQWDQLYHAPEVLERGAKGAVEWSQAEGGQLQAMAPTYIPQVPNTITLRHVDENVWA